MTTFFHRDSFQRYFEFPLPPEIEGREIQFVDIKEGNPNSDDIILVKFDMIPNGNYYLLSKATGEVALVENNYKERAKILVQTQPSGKDLPLLLTVIQDFQVIYPPQTPLNTDPENITPSVYAKAEWLEKDREWKYTKIEWTI